MSISKKTLLVHYSPRGEASRSLKLLDSFQQGIRYSEIERLDLCVETPDLFDAPRLAAYCARNMGHFGHPTTADLKPLDKMLRMTAQLKSADTVAIAFPMFNFSVPAVVKAWFDSVLHVGETIDPAGGGYRGLMSGRRAVVLCTAGGFYSSGNGIGPHFGSYWEHAVSLAKLEFSFMGYSDVRGILAEGMAQPDDTLARRNLSAAMNAAASVAHEWYSGNVAHRAR